MERAELFVVGTDIDYSKRPVKKRMKSRKCSIAQTVEAVDGGETSRREDAADTSKYGFLSENEYAFVVESCLERTLSESDRALLNESYKRLSPLDTEFVQGCLSRAVAGKGSQKHLNFYVTQMEEAKTRR